MNWTGTRNRLRLGRAPRPSSLLFCALAAALATGCVSRTHSLYRGSAEDRTTAVRLASFPLGNPGRPEIRYAPGGHDGRHQLLSIVTRSVGENGQEGDRVTATLYRSTERGRRRLVVVLPIWGSSKYPSRQVVRRLMARRGAESAHVLEVHGERSLYDWPALGASKSETDLIARFAGSAQRLANTVADVRRLIGWAARRDDVDPARIGLVGFSMGAVVGSLVMGRDDRVAAGVLVMGGANLHQTLGTCRGRPGEVRRRVCRRFGWDRETYVDKIERALAPVNPARFAGNVHPDRVLLIDAALDRCMPATARDGLWRAMGRPERISLAYGHQVAFLAMTPLGFHYATRRIVDFLDRRLLDEPPDRPSPISPPIAAVAPGAGSTPRP